MLSNFVTDLLYWLVSISLQIIILTLPNLYAKVVKVPIPKTVNPPSLNAESNCSEVYSCLPMSSYSHENLLGTMIAEKDTNISIGSDEARLKDEAQTTSSNGAVLEPTEKIVVEVSSNGIDQLQTSLSEDEELLLNIDNNDLHNLLNNYRSNNQKSSLVQISELCEITEMRVKDIAESFNHDGFQERISTISYQSIGENIWFGDPFSVEAVIEGWDKSEGHKKNMLGEWTAGCGATKSGYAVYLFMR